MDKLRVSNPTGVTGKSETNADTNVAPTEQDGEAGFFLTGVNVGQQPAAIEAQPDPDEDELGERVISAQVDQYKMLAVVDSARTFSSSDVSPLPVTAAVRLCEQPQACDHTS